MIYKFLLVGSQDTPKFVAVVVHGAGLVPQWSQPQDTVVNAVLRAVFGRDKVFGNAPGPDGNYTRVTRTYEDADFLDYAEAKLYPPLFVQSRGKWDTTLSMDDVIAHLTYKFLGDKNA